MAGAERWEMGGECPDGLDLDAAVVEMVGEGSRLWERVRRLERVAKWTGRVWVAAVLVTLSLYFMSLLQESESLLWMAFVSSVVYLAAMAVDTVVWWRARAARSAYFGVMVELDYMRTEKRAKAAFDGGRK